MTMLTGFITGIDRRRADIEGDLAGTYPDDLLWAEPGVLDRKPVQFTPRRTENVEFDPWFHIQLRPPEVAPADDDPPIHPATMAAKIDRLSGAVLIFAAGWLFGVITTVMVL